jgi:hypothetical protein
LADLLSDEDSKPKKKNPVSLEPPVQPPIQPQVSAEIPKPGAAPNRSRTMKELFGIEPSNSKSFLVYNFCLLDYIL